MSHEAYVALAYGVTVVVLGARLRDSAEDLGEGSAVEAVVGGRAIVLAHRPEDGRVGGGAVDPHAGHTH